MANYVLSLPIIASFFVTLIALPIWIKRAKSADLTGKDVHKNDEKEIAEAGGITVLVGFILGLLTFVAVRTIFFQSDNEFTEILALLSVIIMVSLIGFVDDILGWKIGLNIKVRLTMVLFASIPLIAINAGKSQILIPFLGIVDLGLIYPLIFIPIGIIGATTTFNFLAGYNGLEAGQGIILLLGFSLVAYLTGSSWLAIIGLCMVAPLCAFLIYNYYPAKIFPGDSLTYAIGGLAGAMAILGNFERIAIFFFIPYILETVLKLRGKLKKESFGKLMEDGSLDNRYGKIYGLEHLTIKILKRIGIKSTERKVVIGLWLFQFVIILLGLLIFSRSIF